MELLTVFLLLAVVGLYFISKDHRKIKVSLSRLAVQYRGIVRPVFASYNRLEIPQGDAKIEVSVLHGANGPFTYFTCPVNPAARVSEFTIVSRSMPTRVPGRLSIKQEVETGDGGFDRRFVCRSQTARIPDFLLWPECKRLLMTLSQDCGLEVRLLQEVGTETSYRFDLHLERIVTVQDEYRALIDLGMLMLRSITTSPTDL